MKSKIALTMIVSGSEEPGTIKRCLDSIKEHVDGIFILVTTEDTTGIRDAILKEKNAHLEYLPGKFHHSITKKEYLWIKKFLGYEPNTKVGDKIFQFDKARNHSLKMVPKEFPWFLWLDIDDIYRGGDKLQEVVDFADKNKASSVFLNYIYQAEIADGHIKAVLIEHLRERLIRNGNLYKWVGNIHETLIEQVPTIKIDSHLGDVLHLSDQPRREKAIKRNIKALELSIYRSEGKDPRPIYYLGKALFDLRTKENFLKASKLFNIYLNGSEEHEGRNQSGWKEERSQCWEYLMEICRELGEFNNSIKCGMNALIEFPEFPSIYINLALSYVIKKEYDRALFWVKKGLSMPAPKTTLISNPRDIMARSLEVIYNASLHTSKLDEAWAAAQKLLEVYPESKDMQDRVKFTQNLRVQRELTKAFIEVAKFLEQSGESEKLKPLVGAIPKFIENVPFIHELRRKVVPPRKWKKDELVIYCGPGFTNWSPKMIDHPGENFIGGSEEAVIYLSQELAKDWKVTVYADPGPDEGKYNGVNFQPYYKFNNQDEFNVLVAWRAIQFFDQPIQAKKAYLWCHDIQNPLEYTKERLDKITKVMVLSKFHRSNLPDVPDDKIMITANGISV